MQTIVDSTIETNFKKYGQAFQLAVLRLLVEDKVFANQIRFILKPEYFDNTFCQWFCETILNQLEAYEVAPGWDELKLMIEAQHSKKATVYLVTLKSIQEADLTRRTFYETEVERFCFVKFSLSKTEEEKNYLLAGDFTKAREVAFKKYHPISTQTKELNLKEDFKSLFVVGARNPIPTPLPSLNKVSKEGPGSGDLCVVIAQSNLGKTNYLIATARHAVQLGKKVVYFTLETDRLQLLQRLVAGLINVPQEYLIDHPELVEKKIKELSGECRIIEYKSTQAKVDVLRLKLNELKSQGYFPELIIIDGLNQLKPPRTEKFNNSNDKFEYLAEEVRDLAKELQLPIYVAFQANRGGFNVEVADEQNIGKAIEVYQVADWLVMLTQTVEMAERSECYIQLLKNRLGPKGLMIRLFYDANKNLFQEIETVQRSNFFNKKNREDVMKGLETLKKRIDEAKRS